MLITKFQESPGGRDVISYLLPSAVTMRSGSISCTARYSSAYWWLGRVLFFFFSPDPEIMPVEGQAAADTGSATVFHRRVSLKCHLTHN